MKGTEKIIAHIQADAKAQADAILAQAEQQCAGIREDFDKKAKEAYAEKIRAGVKGCEDLSESKSRIAQMESKKSILALKQEMVSEAFARAKDLVLALPAEKYCAFLAKLAVQSAPDGEGQIVLNASDRKNYGEAVVKQANAALGGKLTLSSETGDFAGGLIVRNGAVEVNNTLELLIDLCRGDMAAEVAKILFG
ncbi:MAG: hypothetical protein J6T99_04380 [Oscillospiraceae bacterium]|jgi:V/A-type H+-transporting ATPase subunit E|nr:hypothetical protein [Oscillospiraceae bacterium]MBO7422606.1 hypothetical protein [Oscillospiraceae bacterium]MBO7728108.1 hypothetical protein [Oscillospiraceae bacterium]MBP5168842.1 hypothetical protein [Oscillospiraceae bacterium]MBQ1402978.1 hypothetical protein [Oscillospiraceae bacterium]